MGLGRTGTGRTQGSRPPSPSLSTKVDPPGPSYPRAEESITQFPVPSYADFCYHGPSHSSDFPFPSPTSHPLDSSQGLRPLSMTQESQPPVPFSPRNPIIETLPPFALWTLASSLSFSTSLGTSTSPRGSTRTSQLPHLPWAPGVLATPW